MHLTECFVKKMAIFIQIKLRVTFNFLICRDQFILI